MRASRSQTRRISAGGARSVRSAATQRTGAEAWRKAKAGERDTFAGITRKRQQGPQFYYSYAHTSEDDEELLRTVAQESIRNDVRDARGRAWRTERAQRR